MIKYVPVLALVAALSACSSDSNSGDSGTTGGGGTTGSGTTGGTTGGTGGTTGGTGGPITPSGGRSGVWFGSNNFGDGVMVIDASENVYTLTRRDADAKYEAVFGPSSEQLQRFIHRDSENAAFADSFTLAGDLPSTIDPNDSDTITYNLTVANEGQLISNTGAAGNFSMTFANENDLPPLSLADLAGSWTTKTSFCPVDCNITLRMNFAESGALTGSTQFNDGGLSELVGGATVAGPQYLTVSFEWLGKTRTGVLHRDRRDINKVIINTVGPGDAEGTSQSFTASMVRG